MGLDYCIDSTKVWLKGNFSPYGTNVYVIKKEIGFAPNGSKVFDFYEPFDTLNGTVWTSIAGTPDDLGGQLSLINSTNAEGIQSIQTFSYGTYGVYMEIRMQRGSATTYAGLSPGSVQWATWVLDGTTDAVHTQYADASYTRINDLARTANTMYTYGIGWKQSAVMFFVDYNLRQTVTTNLPTVTKLPIEILGTAGVYSFVDWVRIRKYIDTEPTVIVIDEGDQYKIIVKNNMDKWLNNYQFAVNIADIGVSSQTESLNIIPMLTASDIYSEFFEKKYFFANLNNVSGHIGTDRFGAINGLLFGGTHGFSMSDQTDISNDFSIFIIYKANNTNNLHLLSKRGGSDLKGYTCWTDAGKPGFIIDNGANIYSVISDTAYSGYVYYGATRVGAEMKMYINGSLNKSTTVSTDDLTTTATTYLGTNYEGQTNHFNGNMDCVILFSFALTDAQHKLLYDICKMKNIHPYANTTSTINTQQKGY